MTTAATNRAAADLQHIANNWTLLRELLSARTPNVWPPAGRMADHQRALEEPDEAEQLHQLAAIERAERTAIAPGPRPAPLRVSTLDLITELEAELNALADQLAAAIQRPAFTVRPANPGDLAARQIALAIAQVDATDRRDPRRWHINRPGQVDGGQAAAWIAARLDGPSGPHRALTPREEQHVRTVAREIRHRLDQALGNRDTTRTPLGYNCSCGGRLTMLTGGITAIECEGCKTKTEFPGAVA
ncbi:hypothetical protein ACWEPB_02625 [Kitasatospora cineracea]